MASKPLHVKRFQNALANYRQELLNKKQNPISFNPSLTPIAFDRYSANAKIKDSSFRPSWISSKLKNDYSKTLSLSATEWLGAVSKIYFQIFFVESIEYFLEVRTNEKLDSKSTHR